MNFQKFMENQEEVKTSEDKFEQDMLIHQPDLWYKLYGEEEADEGVMFRPESDEDVERMVEQFKAAGWDAS